MANAVSNEHVEAVRQFSRYYTKRIGVLQERLLGSEYSLTEVRILYELAHREQSTASEISDDLGLDRGYLSRILRHFANRKLIVRERSGEDARHIALRLTPKGHSVFASLDAKSSAQVAEILGRLPEIRQKRLVGALREAEGALSEDAQRPLTLVLRAHRPGDIGWVIHRHGALYAEEYGWDESFEALVAEIAAQFVKNFDRKRERCWIAELNGKPVGSIFLVKHTDEVAKLRLLLVEPTARGLGVGRRLVDECIHFARLAGYRKITLWTQSILNAARRIYERAGFTLVKSEPNHAFGAELIAETWELDLNS
jgi:DNA-binding MarR family transcriptional regulator/N-acetylglutamate synthase-like GNAT family acetyltransferase